MPLKIIRQDITKMRVDAIVKTTNEEMIGYMDTTQELLATTEFALSRSKVFDKIIRFLFITATMIFFEFNEALFEFDQTLLGAFWWYF